MIEGSPKNLVVNIFGYDEVDSDLLSTALFQSFRYDFGASFQNAGKDVNKLGKIETVQCSANPNPLHHTQKY
jgi:hypothetical protein